MPLDQVLLQLPPIHSTIMYSYESQLYRLDDYRFKLQVEDKDHSLVGALILTLQPCPLEYQELTGTSNQSILVCSNIKLPEGTNQSQKISTLSIKLASRFLYQIYSLSEQYQVPGAVFTIPKTLIQKIPELYQHWLKDLSEFFVTLLKTDKEDLVLYMPCTPKLFEDFSKLIPYLDQALARHTRTIL